MTDLREALGRLLEAVPPKRLAESTQRLIADYRSGRPADEPLLRNMVDATAYAAYRMPATHAAVAAVLGQLGDTIEPRSLLDVGGGSGAATWAALDAFPGLEELTVLDQVPEALKLGERMLPRARWQEWRLGEPLSTVDLVLVSYVLGELTEDAQHTLVDEAGAAARQAVVVVEPGTPLGYRRILDARERLIAAGWTVAAPCPHQERCGMTGKDWCHFAARVNRSACIAGSRRPNSATRTRSSPTSRSRSRKPGTRGASSATRRSVRASSRCRCATPTAASGRPWCPSGRARPTRPRGTPNGATPGRRPARAEADRPFGGGPHGHGPGR